MITETQRDTINLLKQMHAFVGRNNKAHELRDLVRQAEIDIRLTLANSIGEKIIKEELING